MSVPLTYPGVYIQEVPSGSRTITGVATAIAAFVGRASRGPVDEPVPIGSFTAFERVFGGLWRDSGMSYAVRDFFLNGGSNALVVRADPAATTTGINVHGLHITAYGPGRWSEQLEIEVAAPAAGPDAEAIARAQGVTAADLFDLTLRDRFDASAVVQESFANVTVADGARRVDLVLRASRLVRVDHTQALPASRPDNGIYTVQSDGTPGKDGSPLQTAADFGDEATGTGLYALAKAEFTLLCLPPSSPAGDAPDNLWSAALAFCQPRRAFLLVDPPALKTTDDIQTWRGGLGLNGPVRRNAALYFPRISSPDPLRDGAIGDVVPCGAVAGVIARTDAARGVWKAPAGIDAGLAGVSRPTLPLDDSDIGALNPLGINCLRALPVIGPVVWGSRTLSGADVLADEFKYVPVRRLALFLEESLSRGTQWVVFEPNDEPLWGQIRADIGAFLQDLFKRGAFQGRTPREAYFVRCDAETTTQYDIDRGIVNIVVGFAPLKPAEFVIVRIQQIDPNATA